MNDSLFPSDSFMRFMDFNETNAPFGLRHYVSKDVEWPEWLWKPILIITAFVLFLSFLFLLYWQKEINRGRIVPGYLPHYHRVAVSSAEETQ